MLWTKSTNSSSSDHPTPEALENARLREEIAQALTAVQDLKKQLTDVETLAREFCQRIMHQSRDMSWMERSTHWTAKEWLRETERLLGELRTLDQERMAILILRNQTLQKEAERLRGLSATEVAPTIETMLPWMTNAANSEETKTTFNDKQTGSRVIVSPPSDEQEFATNSSLPPWQLPATEIAPSKDVAKSSQSSEPPALLVVENLPAVSEEIPEAQTSPVKDDDHSSLPEKVELTETIQSNDASYTPMDIDITFYTSRLQGQKRLLFDVIGKDGISDMNTLVQALGKKIQSPHQPLGRLEKDELVEFPPTQLDINEAGIGSPKLFRLTNVGMAVYQMLTGEMPAEPQINAWIRDHDNVNHGYLIYRVEQMMKEFYGHKATISIERKANMRILNNGDRVIPDLIVVKDETTTLFEVERGHHTLVDMISKCEKLAAVSPYLYFLTASHVKGNDLVASQVEEWVNSVVKKNPAKYPGLTVVVEKYVSFFRWLRSKGKERLVNGVIFQYTNNTN